VTIYNPIDVAAFGGVSPEARARERAALGIPTAALVIGLVGQVQPIKGHAEFVTAACEVARRVPTAHFLVVGAPPPGDEAARFAEGVRRQADQSSLGDRIHFTGFRSDIPHVMAMLDILAVPSWREPFGRVAVEGMAAGRPGVGTNVGGLPEIISHNVDGLLVAPRDPGALANALVRLSQDAALRTRLAGEGLRTAARFGLQQHAAAVQALYESVLAAGPART
jgi:glycosyltransferase involved in cell wall biosynthesis